MTITARDIRDHVEQALLGSGENLESFDVDAIVADLVDTYDLTGDWPTEALVDVDEFWDIVAKHDRDIQAETNAAPDKVNTGWWKVNFQIRHGGTFGCTHDSEIIAADTDSEARREIYRRHPGAMINTWCSVPAPAEQDDDGLVLVEVDGPPAEPSGFAIPAPPRELFNETRARAAVVLGTDTVEGESGIWVRYADADEPYLDFVIEGELRDATEFVGSTTPRWRAYCVHGNFAHKQEFCACSNYTPAPARAAVTTVVEVVESLAPVPLDPWDQAEPGITLVGWSSDGPGCDAYREFFCTRDPHPAEWQHIATNATGEVLAVWRDSDPVPGSETAADAPNLVAATEDTGDGVGIDGCPVCHGRFPIDADGAFTTHFMGDASAPCTTEPHPDGRDTVRRRFAIAQWMAAHPELPDPRTEVHHREIAAVLTYGYPGPEGLTALYRSLSVDVDGDAVDFHEGTLRLFGWVDGWAVTVVIPFSEWADNFCSRLSASQIPGRFLDIVSGLHHRADDEG